VLVVLVAIAAYAGRLRIDVPFVAAIALGVVVGIAGLMLFVPAAVALGRATSAETPRLLTRGPFALCRHPQTFGRGLMLLAVAIASRSLLALALVGLFVAFALRHTAVEERHLARTFRPEWESYRERVPTGLRLPPAGLFGPSGSRDAPSSDSGSPSTT
jgi:protein-S-isoprenylcysteine O-methyltransferase Ste14